EARARGRDRDRGVGSPRRGGPARRVADGHVRGVAPGPRERLGVREGRAARPRVGAGLGARAQRERDRLDRPAVVVGRRGGRRQLRAVAARGASAGTAPAARGVRVDGPAGDGEAGRVAGRGDDHAARHRARPDRAETRARPRGRGRARGAAGARRVLGLRRRVAARAARRRGRDARGRAARRQRRARRAVRGRVAPLLLDRRTERL
ncbi:MAG: hypothetical protein AVDCRST_MAG85-3910, partial [uncultured Solirubrobacteraceae bacterium]